MLSRTSSGASLSAHNFQLQVRLNERDDFSTAVRCDIEREGAVAEDDRLVAARIEQCGRREIGPEGVDNPDLIGAAPCPNRCD